jgi:hypothetical protein
VRGWAAAAASVDRNKMDDNYNKLQTIASGRAHHRLHARLVDVTAAGPEAVGPASSSRPLRAQCGVVERGGGRGARGGCWLTPLMSRRRADLSRGGRAPACAL